jgi:acetyl-CoA carboxylase carboxyltransferase component
MYAEHGGCVSGGVVVVIGYIQKRMVIVVANDATVKAGAWFPITGKKNLRAQEIAMENNMIKNLKLVLKTLFLDVKLLIKHKLNVYVF